MRKIVRSLIKGLLVAAAIALARGAVAYFIILFISLNPVPTTYAIALGDLNGDD